jgi:hypothetical protein
MADRHFEPAEVESLIPALTDIMGRVMAASTEADEVRGRLRAEQQRITMSGGGVLDQDGWRTGRERLGTLTRRLQAGLEEIGHLGGVPKDLGMGLVDFPHLRDGQEVNLCWKFGEREIRFWHGMNEGFAGRKPL